MALSLVPPAGLSQAIRRSRPAPARSWWLAAGLTVAGLGLLPWMFYLAVSLPASPIALHWPAAWVGLDALEATA